MHEMKVVEFLQFLTPETLLQCLKDVVDCEGVDSDWIIARDYIMHTALYLSEFERKEFMDVFSGRK